MPKGVYNHRKGYKRPPFTQEWKDNIAKSSLGNKAHWKGDDAGYWARHRYIEVLLGRPSKCSYCGDSTKTRYEWANISGEYKRETSDYIRLCKKCHTKYDMDRGVYGNTTKALKLGTFNDYNQVSLTR